VAVLSAYLAIALGGCGDGDKTPGLAESRLQRADLVAVVRALAGTTGPVRAEVAATKAAWPWVVDGLHAETSMHTRPLVQAANESAASLRLPTLTQEVPSRALTGPGAELAGLFRTYTGLSQRGWELIAAALGQIEHGSPAGARFARENVALYIESVYDGHFDLAQVDKKLHAAYRALGGPSAFGSQLTQAEVDALAGIYSESTDRLHPHVGARLGS
jgi:hypothetical protein